MRQPSHANAYTPEFWASHALAGNLVVDLGQIDKATRSRLNALVREGKLARCRGSWSELLIGPLKTIWLSPDASFAVGQISSVEAATPAFKVAHHASRDAAIAEAA